MRHIVSFLLILSTILFISSDGFAYNGYEEPFGRTKSQIRTTDKFHYDNDEREESGQYDDVAETFFNNLQIIGDSYNGGGGEGAANAFIDSACSAIVSKLMMADFLPDVPTNYLKAVPDKKEIGQIKTFLSNQKDTLKNRSLSGLCAALKDENAGSMDLSGELKNVLNSNLFPMAAMAAQNMGRKSGLPFLGRVEFELGIDDGDYFNSITTIQPLWRDTEKHHFVFTQLSWHKAREEYSDEGFKRFYDTFNAGLAYRYLNEEETWLYGANVFFDHAPEPNHNRMSVGLDARTSQLAISANKYFAMSDYKSVNDFYEERAAGGLDLELRGQVPPLPSWTASVKGYQWDNQEDGEDLYGVETALEYSPVPAFAIRAGVRKENQEDLAGEVALTFRWAFDQAADVQLRPRRALAPVSEYVYEKVSRENVIRVESRRKASSLVSVIETSGANTAIDDRGSFALAVGTSLRMPVTIYVANTVGAIARIRTNAGGLITIAQASQVLIEPRLITLVTGSLQYVSDGVITNVAVPGGTIVLNGTDIDVTSNGATSSVRVRDGNVTFTGSVAGVANLNPNEMAKSTGGTIGTVAPGTADYVAHTDKISTQIDRVADPQNGGKVAPYPVEAPRLLSQASVVNDAISIGLKLSEAVTVTGGPPTLTMTINGITRIATYASGSGTDDLVFNYSTVALDNGAASVTINAFNNNGATIMGGGKNAVTTIADTILNFDNSIGDDAPPSGYTATVTTDPVNIANQAAAAFEISNAEVGVNYSYTISSDGGGTNVTGNGVITNATENVTGINVTGLVDGTLTVSVTLTDPASNAGTTVTDTALKDATAPTIASVTPPAAATYAP